MTVPDGIDVWTFQPWAAVRDSILRDGRYSPMREMSEWVGDDDHIDGGESIRDSFSTAYRWVCDTMISRGILPCGVTSDDWRRMTEGSPLYDGDGWTDCPRLPMTPVWGWVKWCARNPKTGRLTAHGRPDLRRTEFHDDGRRSDLLHLRVEPSRLLLTDLNAYNDILNRFTTPPEQACSWPDPVFESWSDAHTDAPPASVVRSWDNAIADVHTLTGAMEPLSVQATFWHIEASDVLDVNGRRARM